MLLKYFPLGICIDNGQPSMDSNKYLKNMRGKVKENPFRKDKCCGGTRKTTLVAPLYERQVITRRK